jgi:tripartite-type tricarboxylate transporter receptor subunit TctC
MIMKSAFASLLMLAATLGVGDVVAAFPDRPLRIVVVVPPGTAADIMARTVAAKLGERLNQPVVVENRPGGNSVIGSESVARAPADGYSLLLFNSAQTGTAALDPRFPLDVERDFAPVAMLGKSAYILAVSNDFPAKTLPEFVAYAKANPGKVNYGSGGHGSPAHLGMELLGIQAGVKLMHVPYKGQAQYNAALATDEIQIAFGTVPGFAPVVAAGRVRPLAAGGLTAPKEFPKLPTIAESGFPGFDIDIWLSLVTTGGTPPDVVKRLSDEIRSVLNDPVVRADLDKRGFVVTPSTPDELAAFIRTDVQRWKEVVKRANLTEAVAPKQ